MPIQYMLCKVLIWTGLISIITSFFCKQPSIARNLNTETAITRLDFNEVSILTFIVPSINNKSNNQFTLISQNNSSKVIGYIQSSVKKHNKKDYQGALTDLNSAIKLDPKSIGAYNNRALLKYKILNDRPGGIYDLQQVVKLLQQQGKQKDAQRVERSVKQWKTAT